MNYKKTTKAVWRNNSDIALHFVTPLMLVWGFGAILNRSSKKKEKHKKHQEKLQPLS